MNVQEDSGKFQKSLWGIIKKIGRFIMQLNQKRIKEYVLRHDQKCAPNLIKASHMSTLKYNNLFHFVEKQQASIEITGNDIVASNIKFPGLQVVLNGEST